MKSSVAAVAFALAGHAAARPAWAHPMCRFLGGLFIINPPHILMQALREALPVLVRLLGQYAGVGHRLEGPLGS